MAPPHKKKRTAEVPGRIRGGRGGPVYGDDGSPAPPAPPGGGGSPAPGPPPPPEELPGFEGLPPADAAKVDAILRSLPVETRATRARAYIRTTAWYAEEYKGIAQGIAKSLFVSGDPEAEYRDYQNKAQNYYKQYFGRAATKDEIAAYLALGYDAGKIGQVGAGHAYVETYRGDIQYYTGAFDTGQLSAEELKAYGEGQSGLDSTLGIKIKAKVESAMQKAQRVFQGTLGSSPTADQGLQNTLQNRRKGDLAA